MRKLILALASFLYGVTMSVTSSAALEKGAVAPDFTLDASLAGKQYSYSLKSALEKGPVVVYFYPSAYTNGCNLQAKTFADHLEKFSDAGASVVGVSLDSIERLNEFSADPEFCGGKVTVASDPSGNVAKSFDLHVREASEGKVDSRGKPLNHGFAERTTFVISQGGQIVETISGVGPVDNVKAALEAVSQLQLPSSS